MECHVLSSPRAEGKSSRTCLSASAAIASLVQAMYGCEREQGQSGRRVGACVHVESPCKCPIPPSRPHLSHFHLCQFSDQSVSATPPQP